MIRERWRQAASSSSHCSRQDCTARRARTSRRTTAAGKTRRKQRRPAVRGDAAIASPSASRMNGDGRELRRRRLPVHSGDADADADMPEEDAVEVLDDGTIEPPDAEVLLDVPDDGPADKPPPRMRRGRRAPEDAPPGIRPRKTPLRTPAVPRPLRRQPRFRLRVQRAVLRPGDGYRPGSTMMLQHERLYTNGAHLLSVSAQSARLDRARRGCRHRNNYGGDGNTFTNTHPPHRRRSSPTPTIRDDDGGRNLLTAAGFVPTTEFASIRTLLIEPSLDSTGASIRFNSPKPGGLHRALHRRSGCAGHKQIPASGGPSAPRAGAAPPGRPPRSACAERLPGAKLIADC